MSDGTGPLWEQIIMLRERLDRIERDYASREHTHEYGDMYVSAEAFSGLSASVAPLLEQAAQATAQAEALATQAAITADSAEDADAAEAIAEDAGELVDDADAAAVDAAPERTHPLGRTISGND